MQAAGSASNLAQFPYRSPNPYKIRRRLPREPDPRTTCAPGSEMSALLPLLSTVSRWECGGRKSTFLTDLRYSISLGYLLVSHRHRLGARNQPRCRDVFESWMTGTFRQNESLRCSSANDVTDAAVTTSGHWIASFRTSARKVTRLDESQARVGEGGTLGRRLSWSLRDRDGEGVQKSLVNLASEADS
jgi:hypothetical protein